MYSTAALRRYALVFLMFVLVHFLALQQQFAEAENVTSTFTCMVFHGEAGKNYTWNSNKTQSIDIVLSGLDSNPFIKCLFNNESYTSVELLVNINNSTNMTGFEGQQYNLSIKSSPNNAEIIFRFENQLLGITEGTILPLKIWMLVSGNSQLIFEGNLVRLASLPSFSTNSLSHTVIASLYQKTLWKFYKHFCRKNLVFIVPQSLSDFPYSKYRFLISNF